MIIDSGQLKCSNFHVKSADILWSSDASFTQVDTRESLSILERSKATSIHTPLLVIANTKHDWFKEAQNAFVTVIVSQSTHIHTH